MADKRFIVEVDPSFIPDDGTNMHALMAALEHFNIPTFIKELPDEDVPAQVIIELDGGLITEVVADRPVNYLVHDRDTEGVAEDSLVVRSSIHTPGFEVTVYNTAAGPAEVKPDLVTAIMQQAEGQNA